MTQSSCLCGANVITFSGTPGVKFRCHCMDERKLTGAAFSLNVIMPTDNLKVISGQLKTWGKKAESGNTITNHACGQCGSLLYRTSDGFPGIMVIKVGCIDGADAAKDYVPDVEVFTRSRAPWVPAIEGAKQELGDFTS